MCGILGGVFRRPVTGADGETFRRAVRTLVHRGPDAEGVRIIPEANAVLAFRRLAIIDLATGDQPMTTGMGHHIIFNGEVYNYRDVRPLLQRDGVQLRTTSDTEVLLHCLARHGLAGLDALRGMWGLGFLDVPRGELLLVRDRLGVKQLYYSDTPVGFFFASEPKALLALPWVRSEFAADQLPAYLTFRSVPAPRTLFADIHKLAAGTAVRYDLATGQFAVTRYWAPPAPDPGASVSAAEALDRCEASVLEAVRRRLVADVPVGAFLSGGLDSSLVVAAMHRLNHPDTRTFSAVFPGSPDDESAFARRVAGRFNAAHDEQPCRHDEFLDALPYWTELNDDLVADASSLPLLHVSRLARARGCIVMLSGEGADELFGGYGSYHKFVLLRRLSAAVPGVTLRRRVLQLAAASGLVADQDRPRVDEYFVRRGGYLGTAAVLSEGDLERVLTTTALRDHAPLPRAAGTSLPALGAFDFERRIPDDLLVRTDRATMGASVEARVPFLDQDLVTLTWRLPARARSVPGVSKIVLRRLARRWGVPLQTVMHRKIGFQLPIGDWFRGPLAGLWETVLRERVVPGINYGALAPLVRAHAQRHGDFEELLWRFAALELWYRRWIDGRRPRAPASSVGAEAAWR